jgi:hypothetical protein
VLTDCEGRLRDTASKKILVEVTLLKMIEARHAVSIDTVLKQVQQLRAEAAGGVAPAPTAAVAAAPKQSAPVRATVESVAVAAPAGEADLEQLWGKLVETVRQASPFVHTYFTEAHPVS